MSDRLKIMACGAVERIEDNILNEVQVQVFDGITKKHYNVDCNLIGEPENGDIYEINIYNVEKGQLVDTCRMDATGGIFMDDDFCYAEIDDDLCSRIIELMTNYFIIPF